MSMPLLLKLYDLDKPLRLQCNAREKGHGASLMQKGKPIAMLAERCRPLKAVTLKQRKSLWPSSSEKNCYTYIQAKGYRRFRSQTFGGNIGENPRSSGTTTAKDIHAN